MKLHSIPKNKLTVVIREPLLQNVLQKSFLRFIGEKKLWQRLRI